jgi:hypothetical protein
MVHGGFIWSAESWTPELSAAFTSLQEALVNACAIYYPRYDLDWVLRVDASDRGACGVLLQIERDPDGTITRHFPLAFTSKKFSEVAPR